MFKLWEKVLDSLLAEVSHDEAKMRERRETLSFLSFLPRRERPLLAGKVLDRNMFGVSSCARTHKPLCLCILRGKPDLFNPNKNTLLLWTGVSPNPEPVNFELTRSLSSAVSLGARLNRRLWSFFEELGDPSFLKLSVRKYFSCSKFIRFNRISCC